MANYWENLGKQVSESGLDPSSAQTAGLTKAYELMGGAGKTAYPTLTAPEKKDYYDLTKYTPYQTLTDGDVDKLRQGLQAPIMTQSEQQKDYLGDVYGGRGLYGSAGSGLMSGALAQEQQATQTALSGTEKDLYDIKLKELAKVYESGKDIADQANIYGEGLSKWDLQQAELARNFANQQAMAAYADQLAKEQAEIDNYMALAGLGSSGAGISAQLDAAREAAKGQETAGLYGALGQIGGGLMSKLDTSSWF